MIPDAEGFIGRDIGGYALQRLLGNGGTGAVYLAQPTGTAAPVAIKLLVPPWHLSAEGRDQFRARFRRGTETLARLHHPHILPILDHGEAEGIAYLVMPYMAGGDLAHALVGQRGTLPLATAARYVSSIADALDYLHSQGVIHRDIKPANVLLDDAGVVYLADFGIARLLEVEQTTITLTGQALGTPTYMAPEQAQSVEVSPSADIYSLGIVAYELVTGQVPFTAKMPMEVLLQHAQAKPTPPRQLRPDLPVKAEAAILRALAKRPHDRFTHVAQFAGAFNDAMQPLIRAQQALSHQSARYPGERYSGDTPQPAPLLARLAASLRGGGQRTTVSPSLGTAEQLATGTFQPQATQAPFQPATMPMPALARRKTFGLLAMALAFVVVVAAIGFALPQGLGHFFKYGFAVAPSPTEPNYTLTQDAKQSQTISAQFAASSVAFGRTYTAETIQPYSTAIPGPCDTKHADYWHNLEGVICMADNLELRSDPTLTPPLYGTIDFHGPYSPESTPFPLEYSFSIQTTIDSPHTSNICVRVLIIGRVAESTQSLGIYELRVCPDTETWSISPTPSGPIFNGSFSAQTTITIAITVQHGNAQVQLDDHDIAHFDVTDIQHMSSISFGFVETGTIHLKNFSFTPLFT